MTTPTTTELQLRASFGPITGLDVQAALTTAFTRHRGPVTVAELAWVWAAEKEWAQDKFTGPQVVVDPAPSDLAALRRQLITLQAAGLAVATGDRPQRWRPTSDGRSVA